MAAGSEPPAPSRSASSSPPSPSRRAGTRPSPRRGRAGQGGAFAPPSVGDRVEHPPLAPPPDRSGSILDEHRPDPPITITHESVITGDMADQLWSTYHENFDPLADLAVQAQSSGHDEMLAEFANPRIDKIVAWQRGRPVGLGLVTNHLESVPDISPRFLRSTFPDHAAHDAIFIGMYVMVEPGHRGLTLFHRLYLEMWQVPARVGGVLVFDVCEFNRTTFDTDQLAERIASNFPRSSVSVIDRQTWYAAELPEPIPDPSRPRRGRRR